MHFTGQQRDSEDSLTYFQFRQLSTTQGRWISVDPAGLGAVNFANPQTWNRYVYVMNNPLNLVDPSGLEPSGVTGGTPTSESNCTQDSGGNLHCRDEITVTAEAPQVIPVDYIGSNNGVTNQLAAAGRTVNNAISRVSDYLNNHPLLAISLTLGTNPEAWEQEEPALEEEAESLEATASSRVKELSDALGKTKDYVTTAITETKEGIRIISSSENALRPA